MNLDSVLDSIQNFRSNLDAWGMTTQVLLLLGLVSFVLLILSVREISSWFLRIHSLRREIHDLNVKIDKLSQLVARHYAETHIETAAAPAEPAAATSAPKITKDNSQFRLDH